jgi:ribosomal protein L37AE/L43A
VGHKAESMDDKLFWFSLGVLRTFPTDVHTMIMRKARPIRKNEIRDEQKKPLCGRSTFAKRRRAKKLGACQKCGRYFHEKKYNQCSEPISGRALDRLDWIVHGQSKDYPDAPGYSGTELNRFVRQEINRVAGCSNYTDTEGESD